MKIFLPNLTPVCIRLDDIQEQLDRPTLRDNLYLELEYKHQLKELPEAMMAVFRSNTHIPDIHFKLVEEVTREILKPGGPVEGATREILKPGVLSGLLSMLGREANPK